MSTNSKRLQLSVLMDLNFRLVGQRDPAQLLDTCCSAIRSILNCRYARLALVEEDGKTKFFGDVKRNSLAGSWEGSTSSIKTVHNEVMAERYSRWNPASPAAFDTKPGSRTSDAYLVVPFAGQSRVYGWICIADKEENARFTDEDEELAAALSTQTSIAYENIIINDRLQRQAEELRFQQIELQSQNKELRKAQAELESSRAKYADLFDFAPVGYFTSDPVGLICEVNQTGCRLLGISKPELLNKAFTSFIIKPDDLIFTKHQKKTFMTQQRQTCELRLRRSDGVVFYAQLESIAVENLDGMAGHIRTAITDITERKRAEEAVQRSNQLFDVVVNNTHLLMVCLDADFNFIWVNRVYAETDGKKPDFFPGKNHFDLFPNEENEAIFRNVIQTGKPFFIHAKPFEYKDHPERGVTYWDWSLIPIVNHATGKVERLVFTLLNVTERKVNEAKVIQQNAILEEINHIFREAMDCGTEEELGQICLASAEALTKSKFGFIGEIGPDGVLNDIAVSNPGRPGHRLPPEVFEAHGLCGLILSEGKSFFTSEPASYSDRLGLPCGNPSLTAFLGAPLVHAGKTIGLVVVANRESGYRAEDMEALEALTVVIVQVFLRRRAEEALHKNEERLREYVKILEYAPLMVRNMKEEIILWNRGMERIYGYSSVEAIGGKSWQLLKTTFPQPADEIISAVRNTGKWEGELAQETRDGKNIIVSSLWIQYNNEEGKEAAIIELNYDITSLRFAEEAVRKLNEELESRVRERTTDLARTITALQSEVAYRRKAEEALRESQFNLAKAQSLAHIGSWSYDLRSHKFVSSDEFYNIFGMKRRDGEVDLRTIEHLIHPEDREKVRERIGELTANGKVKPLDYRIILPDGSTRIVWTEAEMTLEPEGGPASVIGTVHDITERKLAEEELTRLATAVESAADAVVITESAHGVIQYVNPAFEKITGYSRSEAVGRNLHMLDSGSHDQVFYQELRSSLHRNGFWTGRLVQKRKDGTLYDEECTYSLVKNPSGKVINYISIKRDVTEKARLESIAQAVDTMNNIGYIFAGVSHEIGNPVSAMGMTLDIMTRKMDSLPVEKMKHYVSHLTAQLRSVEYLLKTLKSFNMYENLDPTSLEISRFVETFLSMVKQDFQSKGITIDASIDSGAKFVFADPRALQQVLLNIFTNAADALAGRDMPVITLRVSESAGKVRLRIEDNGRGIEEGKLKELFKPFYTTKPHGTGLGLVIIRKMLAKMRGTVNITSRLNVGTAVEIEIPSSES